MDELNKDRAFQPGHQGFERNAKARSDRRREREIRQREKLDDALERGLEETFPASDAISVVQPMASTYQAPRR
jgi:hypothetical protein